MAAEYHVHVPSAAEKLPSYWTWESLEAVCEGVFDCPHSTPVVADDGPYLARSQDMRSGVFRLNDAARVSEATYSERIARAEPRYGDLLYSREGTYFGIAAEVPSGQRVCLGQRMVLIRPRPDVVNFRYLRYWLNSPVMALHTRGLRDGSVAERLNVSTIRSLPIALPPLAEQGAIAQILGALDDKIELNRRMSETLQSMAQALFKCWFVEFEPVRAKAEGRESGLPKDLSELFPDRFTDSALGEIPEGWDVNRLADPGVFPLVPSGVTLKATDTAFYIATGDVQRDSITGETESEFRKLPSRAKMQPGYGRIWFAKMKDSPKFLWTMREDQYWWSNRVLSTGFSGLEPASVHHESLLYCFVSSSLFEEWKNHLATGTTMQAINNETIASIGLVVPDDNVAGYFDRAIRPLLRRVWQNFFESRNLEELRNELLPKFVSGELGVKGVGREIEVSK